MSKVMSIIILGMILGLVPFFFFFIGLKVNYIDLYEIKEYYNVFFVEEISWPLYFILSLLLGVLFVLPKKSYLGGIVFTLITIASLASMHEDTAQNIGHKLFAKEKFHIKMKPWTYTGTLLYEGRDHYYLFNEENNRTITFRKEDIDEAY